MPANDTYIGKEQITSLNTVKSLTVPVGARWAILVPETQAIRVNLASTTPDSTDMPIAVGQPLEVTTSLAAVRLLEQTPSAKVNVWYFA